MVYCRCSDRRDGSLLRQCFFIGDFSCRFYDSPFSFFLSSVYLQVAIFTVISLLVISYLMLLQRHLREVDFYSEILRRHIGKTVTVHEWRHNRYATVQYNGRVWEAEIAFNAGGNLRAGKYKIWKMLSNRLVLIP